MDMIINLLDHPEALKEALDHLAEQHHGHAGVKKEHFKVGDHHYTPVGDIVPCLSVARIFAPESVLILIGCHALRDMEHGGSSLRETGRLQKTDSVRHCWAKQDLVMVREREFVIRWVETSFRGKSCSCALGL